MNRVVHERRGNIFEGEPEIGLNDSQDMSVAGVSSAGSASRRFGPSNHKDSSFKA
jgi:hypothetical protein